MTVLMLLTTYGKTSFKWFMALVMALGVQNSWAGQGTVKGHVGQVRTHDAAAHSGWAPPRFWFTVKVAQAGKCQKWQGNSILFVANDKQALTMVLAAQTTKQEIEVVFNDDVTVHGWCSMEYITLAN